MQEKNLIRLLTLILMLGLIPLKVHPVEKVRNIVVFFSLNPNLPAYKNFLVGLRSSLSDNTDESRSLIIEYLDIDRIEDEAYAKHIVDIYNTKFKSLKIDLLITFGPKLNPILLKYGLKALNTTPVIDVDVDMPGRVQVQLSNQNRSEILLKFDLEKTLYSALNLFPDYKNVFIISGSTELDKFFNSLMDKSTQRFEKEHVFKTITGLSMDSILFIVKQIPSESIIIVPNFFGDANNVPYTVSEVISFISENCKAPVIPVTDSFIDLGGSIGGYVYSYVYLGKEAGRITNEMLSGKQAKDITINESSFYQHMYDWKELKKWGLLKSKAIPAESIFFNESFLYKYKNYTIGLVIFLTLQTMLIFYLVGWNKRQKKNAEQMMETEFMHHDLVRRDRMAKMTELTASLSHELNQPITAILYSAQAGKRFLEQGKLDPDQANEIFNCIIDDDKRAGKIINTVRNLMRPEARDYEKTNLNILIQETFDIIKSAAIRKNIKIYLFLGEKTAYVFGDKIQLQQVLMNLINNSFNALEESGARNRFIKVSMLINRNSVIVSVRDSGPGFDPLLNEKLFKPFITTRKNGSGIGLALSKTIIENHKGKIWAANIDGGGADFSFSLHTYKET